MASGELYEGAHWGKPGEPHGPRTTEDYWVAQSFIEYNMHWGEGGVIVLDRNLLEHDFELVPYKDKTYSGHDFPGGDEKEIAIITPKVENLAKYLVAVICHPDTIEQSLDPQNIESAIEECGWCYGRDGADRNRGIEQFRREIEILRNSPLLNVMTAPDGTLPRIGNWVAIERGIAPA